MDQFCIEVFMFHSRHEDRLCIAQHDLALKAQGIRGLGCFLAKSRNLTILWSGRYFSRLSLGEIFRLRFVKVSKVWCFVTVLSGFFRKKILSNSYSFISYFHVAVFFLTCRWQQGVGAIFHPKSWTVRGGVCTNLHTTSKTRLPWTGGIFKSYQLTCVSGHFTQYAGKV